MSWFKTKQEKEDIEKRQSKFRLCGLISEIIDIHKQDYDFNRDNCHGLVGLTEEIINTITSPNFAASIKKEEKIGYYDCIYDYIENTMEERFAHLHKKRLQHDARDRILSNMTYGEKAIFLSQANIDYIELENKLRGEKK